MSKNILCSFGVDVDAVAGWLGSYGGEASSLDISRGLFAGEVGAPRLVKLFYLIRIAVLGLRYMVFAAFCTRLNITNLSDR